MCVGTSCSNWCRDVDGFAEGGTRIGSFLIDGFAGGGTRDGSFFILLTSGRPATCAATGQSLET
jgi:hypothetical protein